MNQSEAFDIVENLLFGLQRLRSMQLEETVKIAMAVGATEVTSRNVLAELYPWVHSSKGDAFITSLAKTIDGGKITGMNFYNYMTIISRLEPDIGAMLEILLNMEFPEPNAEWIFKLESDDAETKSVE